MQKSQKLEKGYFSNWTDSKIIFDTEIDENEIQNCKSLEQNTFAAVNKINNVCKVHNNVLLSVQKDHCKLYILPCAMEERKKNRCSSYGWRRLILMWQWNSLTLVIS